MPKRHRILIPVMFLACWTAGNGLAPQSASADANNAAPTATVEHSGFLECFDNEQISKKGKVVPCQPSAAVIVDGELLVAHDKEVFNGEAVKEEGLSPVFAFSLNSDRTVDGRSRYLPYDEIRNARKLEAMTIAGEGRMVLATTAFDRVKTEKQDDGDQFNRLLAWSLDQEDQVELVGSESPNGVPMSLQVREGLSRALADDPFPDGAPYFKVEGLAALPDGRLLFGIRAVGCHYKYSRHTIGIVSVSYEATESGLSLGDDYTLVLDYDASKEVALNNKDVALSGLEYDERRKRLLILSSYEEDLAGAEGEVEAFCSQKVDKNGKPKKSKLLRGYLWVLPFEHIGTEHRPSLVRTSDGSPLEFLHKPEGLAIIDEEHLLVVHDDDKCLFQWEKDSEPSMRQSYQARYSVVRLSDPAQ